jgi:L-fuculose-phosphate aldolase
MSETAARAEVAAIAQRLHARGWVANHDGNVTLRAGDGRYYATPTATSKAAVDAGAVIVVDEAGARVSGRGKPFGEIGMHLTVYRNRADVNAVVHAHPPAATGFAVAGVELPPAMIAEAVVSLGVAVPTVPFAAPGAAACQALAAYVLDYDAVLLAGHGVIAWGADLEQAYLRMELVEHLAKIAINARLLGGARSIPQAVIPSLLESRRKAGLGAAADRAGASSPPPSVAIAAPIAAIAPRAPAPTFAAPPAAAPPTAAPTTADAKRTVVACAPAPPGSDVEVYDPKRPRAAVLPAPAELATIIRQEIINALSKK